MASHPNSSTSSEFEREVGRLTVIDANNEKLYCCFEEIVPVDQYLSGAPQIVAAPGELPQEVVERLGEVLQHLQAVRPPRTLMQTGLEQTIVEEEVSESECKVDYENRKDSYIDRPKELTDFSTLPPPQLSAPWESLGLTPEDEPEDNGFFSKTEDEDYKDTVSRGGIVDVQCWSEDEECSSDEIHLTAYQEKDISKIIFGDG